MSCQMHLPAVLLPVGRVPGIRAIVGLFGPEVSLSLEISLSPWGRKPKPLLSV